MTNASVNARLKQFMPAQPVSAARNSPVRHLGVSSVMRYLVKARLKPGREKALLQAIANSTLGQGSIAGDEYVYDMEQARADDDGVAHWVETCFCDTPLAEERPYWEEYFELLNVKDAHSRRNCRHENDTQPWACGNCDCTKRLEEKLQQRGQSLLEMLRETRGLALDQLES
jgi:hypothetical protein